MIRRMPARLAALLACLLFASAAAAETVYKYRRADGRTVYSNRPVSGLELIETFDYTFPAPVRANQDAAKYAAEAEARIRQRLAELQAAWTEVQDANRELLAAEQALRAGAEPEAGDRQGAAITPLPPPVKGQPPATQPGVGIAPPASPAVGGSMSGRRGRPSPEYVARMRDLEGAVAAARTKLDAALRRYNELR
jgi:hypothetical protein